MLCDILPLEPLYLFFFSLSLPFLSLFIERLGHTLSRQDREKEEKVNQEGRNREWNFSSLKLTLLSFFLPPSILLPLKSSQPNKRTLFPASQRKKKTYYILWTLRKSYMYHHRRRKWRQCVGARCMCTYILDIFSYLLLLHTIQNISNTVQ